MKGMLKIDVSVYLNWLLVDYFNNIISLSVILLFPEFRTLIIQALRGGAASSGHWGLDIIRFLWPVILAVLYCLITGIAGTPIDIAYPGLILVEIPKPDDQFLHVIDLTFGLLLVAVSEELVFRVALKGLIERLTTRPSIILLVSSMVFALAHWPMGPGNVLTAFLAGLALMYLYQRTGSIRSSIATHYVVNLWAFY